MFNFFNKNKKVTKCYLIESNYYDKKILDEYSNVYIEILNDNSTSELFKSVITNYYIPFNLSYLKLKLNKEFYEEPFSTILNNKHPHIAPSLITIKENVLIDNSMGYPLWFIIAFPDVILWIMRDKTKLVESKFKAYSTDELFEKNQFKNNILIKMINLYLDATKNQLECKKY